MRRIPSVAATRCACSILSDAGIFGQRRHSCGAPETGLRTGDHRAGVDVHDVRDAIVMIIGQVRHPQTRHIVAPVTCVNVRTLDHLVRRQVVRAGKHNHTLNVGDPTRLPVIQRNTARDRSLGKVRASQSQNPIRISDSASAFSTVSCTAK